MSQVFSKIKNFTDNFRNNEEESRIRVYSDILKKNPEFINFRCNNGETALLSVCKNFPDEYNSIKFLLDNGACPNIPDMKGDIPYTHLKKYKNKYSNIMNLLLQYGSSKKNRKNYTNSSSCTKPVVLKKLEEEIKKEEIYIKTFAKLFDYKI